MTRALNSFCMAACWFTVSLVATHWPAAAAESDAIPKHFAASEGSISSGYYHVQLDGSALLYRAPQSKKAIRILPTPAQWREFRRAIDDIKIWQWRPQYFNSRPIADGGDWSLRIEYSDQSLVTRGYANYPEQAVSPSSCLRTTNRPFRLFRAAVGTLVGGRSFGYRVSALEFYELAELQLIATHPSPNRREQWAEFRDPTGKVHRVWRRPSDCCVRPSKRPMQVGAESGLLLDVTTTSVTLRERCEDDGGDWFERDRVVKKIGVP